MSDLTQLAQQCGATIYRHRLTPQSPAVAFGDEAWAKFQAEVQALRKDAERYRWWRNNACNKPSMVATLLSPVIYPDDLDAAIDAARKEQT